MLPLSVPPGICIYPTILAADVLDLAVGHFVLAALDYVAAGNEGRVAVDHIYFYVQDFP